MSEISIFDREAAALLGPKGFTTDSDAMTPWLTDWRGRYHGAARALASPADTQEVASLMRLCRDHGIPVVPQGGNSGMVGGATPDESGEALLLSLRRIDECIIDTDARLARCGAGVVLQVLHEAAGDERLRFPLSLGGKGSATVGGLISTNAGGTQVLRHGVMRALVAGLEVVTVDGTVLDLMSPLRKDNRGTDLKQLFIGSEGTLGIVTRAHLNLAPAIAERRVVWCGLSDLSTARRLLDHCEATMGSALEGFEVLPQACLESVLDYLPDARAPLADAYPWHAVLEFVDDTDGADVMGEALGGQVEACLAAAFEGGLIEDAAIAANEQQAEAFWLLRETISPAEKAKGPAVQHDISVPVAAMPDTLATLEAQIEAQFAGHRVRGFGHLGDGNIHFHVLAPEGVDDADSWEQQYGKAISRLVYDEVIARGGSISAEHGIGQDKAGLLAETRPAAELAVMAALKRALDPAGLLNPAKLLGADACDTLAPEPPTA